MKIIRLHKNTRLFVDRDSSSWDKIPDISEFLPDPTMSIKYGYRLLVSDHGKMYQKQIRTKTVSEKKLIKEIRDSFKKDPLNLFREVNPSENYHILTGLSNKDSLLISKDLNKNDRLIYRVYKAKLVDIEVFDGGKLRATRKEYVQEVVLESCSGHNANGVGCYLKKIR